MGRCNCGHLARVVTRRSVEEVQSLALERGGDWSDQVRGYCPSSGLPMEDIFAEMMSVGLTKEDIAHLERLSDPEVAAAAGGALDYRRRADVVRYLNAWADLLQARLLPSLAVPEAVSVVSDEAVPA